MRRQGEKHETIGPRWWCYICDTAHPWSKPCPPVPRSRIVGCYTLRHEARR